jgi:hypothetical protein
MLRFLLLLLESVCLSVVRSERLFVGVRDSAVAFWRGFWGVFERTFLGNETRPTFPPPFCRITNLFGQNEREHQCGMQRIEIS